MDFAIGPDTVAIADAVPGCVEREMLPLRPFLQRSVTVLRHLKQDILAHCRDGVRVRDDRRLGDVGRGLAVAMDGVT